MENILGRQNVINDAIKSIGLVVTSQCAPVRSAPRPKGAHRMLGIDDRIALLLFSLLMTQQQHDYSRPFASLDSDW
jgi:hypothetical protein